MCIRDRAEGDAHRCKENQQYQGKRSQAGQIQMTVGKETDAEQRAVRTHIVGLNHLGQGKYHKCHGLTAGQSAGDSLSSLESKKILWIRNPSPRMKESSLTALAFA